MSGMWRLRAAALLLIASLGVHHGRYLFATAEHAHGLAEMHRYLPYAIALTGGLLFLAVAQLALLVRRGGRDGAGVLPRARWLWVLATTCLLSVFTGQECVETLTAHGHLPALGELLGDGGWAAVPLAVIAGAVVALLLKGAEKVVAWALLRSRPRRVRCAVSVLRAGRPLVWSARRSVLARRLAGRGPPPAAQTI